jgi:hypothetical protein
MGADRRIRMLPKKENTHQSQRDRFFYFTICRPPMGEVSLKTEVSRHLEQVYSTRRGLLGIV